MAVKLTVLSGSMQGHVLETNKNIIRVGADNASELAFDVLSDPEIEGQQVRFDLLDDRWRLFNASTQPLFVNQDLVRDATGVRSGDLIRLSQDGPDVLFELIQSTSSSSESRSLESLSEQSGRDNESSVPEPAASENQQEEASSPLPAQGAAALSADLEHQRWRPASTASETADVKQTDDRRKHKKSVPVTRRKSTRRRRNRFVTLMTLVAVPIGAISGISVAVVLLWVIWEKDPLGIMQQPLVAEQNDADPDGRTQQDRQPEPLAEKQIPRPLPASDNALIPGTKLPSDTTQVPPSPPTDALTIKPFELKTIDLSTTPSLVVDLSSNVTHSSDSVVHYQRDPNTQPGVAIDSLSGLLVWSVPSELKGQEIEIPFLVSSGSPSATVKRGILKLQVSSTEPERASKREVPDSIYLIATETKPGDLYLPLGTACSIERNTLLTSASVAMGLFDAQKRGWKTVALQTSNPSGSPLVIHEITEVKAHRIYLDANQKEDREGRLLQQAYFDLAILKTPNEMESTLALRKTSEEQVDVESFTCISYPISGNTILDLSKLSPLQEDVKLIARIAPANAKVIEAKPPLLLQFEGDVPANIFGGIFLDANSEVVGIFTFSAARPVETESPNVFYATESLPAQSLLNDNDRNQLFWMSASEHAATQ